VVDAAGVQRLLQVVDHVHIGDVGQLGLVVVRREGIEDVLRIVVEIEDEGLLAGEGAVEPRQGLHAVHALQLLVHVHGAELGLVEAGLEFVGGDHHVVVVGVEGLGQVAALEPGVEQLLVSVTSSGITSSGGTLPEKATSGCTSS
jgi:hypothetical protein